MSEGLVTVTGASGYIGSHVVANLLARGRDVRATVRDSSDPIRVDHLRALPVAEGGTLEIVEMDLFDEASVHAAIANCTDLIHTAAAVRISAKNPQRQIVDPSVIGTRNVVAAIDAAGTVERFVHTSSTAAIRPMAWKNGETLTTETWADDATLEGNPYGLAKVMAERIVRKWHSEGGVGKPRMVTIHPSVVFGPPMSEIHLRGSLSFLNALVKRKVPLLIPIQINIVDVRDVAEAHVRALTMGQNAGRYLTVSGDMQFSEISRILRKEYPELKTPRFTVPYVIALVFGPLFDKRITLSWARQHLKRKLYWDATPAERELGMSWKSARDSVIDSVPGLLEKDSN
ncbi:MAG: NAD-dependent epimerase/dehydratase family protein [Candidatus Thalassarchaeum sp.]|nr:NAD-dependent epimerase/dehydratase family protein [Candidatus Thalassarchaeum sp.]HJM23277.1 NAD-dependent epimerase/dehydratase family protein [Candidatus Thalassarchaeum sp.]